MRETLIKSCQMANVAPVPTQTSVTEEAEEPLFTV